MQLFSQIKTIFKHLFITGLIATSATALASDVLKSPVPPEDASVYIVLPADGAETVVHIIGDRKVGENKLLKLSQTNQAFPTSLPNLTVQGYHYKRMQQLDFDGKPVLQMVFYKPGKRPLAVCLMPDDMQFDAQFSQHHLLNSYVWQSGETRAIVVAEESLGVMEKIAKKISI